MNWLAVAKIGYEAYVLQMSLYELGTSAPPDLPAWEELSSKEQLSWITAAASICNASARAVFV